MTVRPGPAKLLRSVTLLRMRRRSLVVSSAVMIVIALAGCAPAADVPEGSGNEQASTPVESPEPAAPAAVDAAALAQAQAWLEAVDLPPGAVRTESSTVSFNSYNAWPCGPYEEMEGHWVVPGMTAVDAANWLIENPPADLVTTRVGPLSEDDATTMGYLPRPGAQEGIVYTVVNTEDGAAVRAEVAAQTDTATCPPLPDGGSYGAPGEG